MGIQGVRRSREIPSDVVKMLQNKVGKWGCPESVLLRFNTTVGSNIMHGCLSSIPLTDPQSATHTYGMRPILEMGTCTIVNVLNRYYHLWSL